MSKGISTLRVCREQRTTGRRNGEIESWGCCGSRPETARRRPTRRSLSNKSRRVHERVLVLFGGVRPKKNSVPKNLFSR